MGLWGYAPGSTVWIYTTSSRVLEACATQRARCVTTEVEIETAERNPATNFRGQVHFSPMPEMHIPQHIPQPSAFR
jgi:hypothetical protein